jgi:hypothetical protein
MMRFGAARLQGTEGEGSDKVGFEIDFRKIN